MNHENKIVVLKNIESSIKDDEMRLPWLLICRMLESHEWEEAALDLGMVDIAHIHYRTLQHLEMWLDSKPQPHILIVDEYDPGLRGILKEILPKIAEGGHRLFMARPHDAEQPKPQQIKETLDFMAR